MFEQTDVLVPGDVNRPRHTSFDFATPLSATELLIVIDYGNLDGSQHDNIGMDNIRFGQNPPAVIPLPAAHCFCLWVTRRPLKVDASVNPGICFLAETLAG